MIPVATYSFGIAFVMPAMSTAALAPFGKAAGVAASMMGFIQMGTGLVMGTLGALMGNALLAMGILIPLLGAMACAAFLVYRRLGPAVATALPDTPATGPAPILASTGQVSGCER